MGHSVYSCFATMGLPLKIEFAPANITRLRVLRSAIHRLTVANCATLVLSLTFVNRITKYDLRLKCMLARRGCPALEWQYLVVD